MIQNLQNLIRLFLYFYRNWYNLRNSCLFRHQLIIFLLTFQEALKNILIIFAKLNPGVKYVQGMNEILAPLYYVLKNDPDEENAVSVVYIILLLVIS